MTVKELLTKLTDFPMYADIRDSEGDQLNIEIYERKDDWGNRIVVLSVNGEERDSWYYCED